MGRASSIEQLPPDVLEKLQALLRDPRVTQLKATAEINAILADMGEEPVSKSALNRYAQRMDAVGERLRQSRAVAEMWIARLGAAPQGQVGHLVNEILRTLSFDLSLKLQDIGDDPDAMPAVIAMLKELSLSVMRLERASSENVKREQQIREQAKREAADAAQRVAAQGGMSEDTAQQIRAAILGLK